MAVASELRGGVRMARADWARALAIGAIIAAAAVALCSTLANVLTQVSVLRATATLRHDRAVSFTPYYDAPGVTQVSRGSERYLARSVADGQAYAAVVNNVEVDRPGFAGGHRVIVVLGRRAAIAMPGVRLCTPAPCAMYGYGLAGVPLAGFRLAEETVPRPTERLPPSATWVDPSAAGASLKQTIVVRLPPSAISHLNAEEREEALTRTVFLRPTRAAVDHHVRLAAARHLYLVPESLATSQLASFRDVIVRSVLYCLGLAGLLALVLLCFAAVAAASLREWAASLAIRRLYGATTAAIRLRALGYLSAVALALPVPVLLVACLFGVQVRVAALVCMGVLVAVVFLLGIRGTRALVTDDVLRGLAE